jgi:hypothetical protein
MERCPHGQDVRHVDVDGCRVGRLPVWVQVLELADDRKPDKAGAEIWSSRQTTDTVARAFVRALDEVAHKYGESGYHGKWGSPFPRFELEALRTAWRDHKDESPGSPA